MSKDHDNSSTSFAAKWAETVRREHEQADRVRSDDPDGDFWKKLAHRFEPMDREKALKDETLVAVRRFVNPTDTVIDVGAGAGRLAVPLAELCRHVTAVEPSKAMQERLRMQAEAWNVTNISIVPSEWQETQVDPADIVVCAHVVYTVEDIAPFVRKLTAASKRDVLAVVFEEPAMANYFPLWNMVYGEERISLPSFPELKKVLSEMRLQFDCQSLGEWESRPFANVDAAYDESAARLLMAPEIASEAMSQRLRSAVEESLVAADGGMRFRWARPHRPWLIHWNGA